MPEATVNGVALNFLDEGQGEPILFLHGLGSCGEDWILQLPVFARRYRVIAPDLRGHGQSGKPAGPYSIGQMASDVVALLGALGVERAHIVGLSLGGLVAQQMAIDDAGRVWSLALTNTFAHLLSGSLLEMARLIRRGLVSMALPLERSAAYVADGLFPYPHQAQLRDQARRRIAGNDRAAYRASLAAVRRFDSRRDLRRITCPTLVVTGERDRTVPRDRQRQLACGIRGARWELVRDSGHATPIDQPEAYNSLLERFLAGVPALHPPSWQYRTIDAHAGVAG